MRLRPLFLLATVASGLLTIILHFGGFRSLLVMQYGPQHAAYVAHPELLWINVVCDVFTAISYAIFFAGLSWLVRRLRHTREFQAYLWVVAASMVFIFVSGITTLIRIAGVWLPMYQFSIVLRIVCAGAIVSGASFFACRAPAMARSVQRFFDLLSTSQQQRDRLRKSEEFLDRTGRLAGVGGWEVDLVTEEVTWSAETCRIHGAAPGYLPTLAEGLEMYAPEARETILEAVRVASEGGPGWDLELPVIRFDGRRIRARTVGLVEMHDGKPVRLVGAFQDVTSIVEAREALRQANEEARQAAKEQLRLKDEFLSHVSHELRSPLTSIYSFSSIIADDLAGATTPQQQEYLQIVLKNVTQLQSMIEDLLTVTQSREGKLTIEPHETAIADAIMDSLHTVQGAAARKQIGLVSRNGALLPPVFADPTRLRQVLIILLDNAIKFTPAGGTITVRASEKTLGMVLVQVEDTGCGIPMEKWSIVFENLYQITDASHTDTSQAGRTGLGLGLHIARDLIRRQGGQIWVTSTPGQGSIFHFTVPVSSAQPDNAPGAYALQLAAAP